MQSQLTRALDEALQPLAGITSTTSQIQEAALSLLATTLRRLQQVHRNLLEMLRPSLEDVAKILGVKEEIERQLADLIRPLTVELSYAWRPRLKSDPAQFFVPNEEYGLSLTSRLLIPVDPLHTTVGEPSFNVVGELRNFDIQLLGSANPFLIVQFTLLKFSSRSGAGATSEVVVRNIEFCGCLAFIEKLRNWLKGRQGFFLDIRLDQLITGFRFGLPTVPLGAFFLQNVRFEIAFRLPFDGDPFRVLFGVSSKRDPFELTTGVYGGIGWVQMVLGPDGVESFSLGLAFGLVGRISIGPISGSGRLVAGIAIERTRTSLELTGFVATAANVTLIGLSVSVYGYLGLRYREPGGCEGEVLIEVTISLFMFEVTFGFHVVKQFSGTQAGSQSALAQPQAVVASVSQAAVAAALDRDIGPSSVDALDDEADEIDWKRYFDKFEEPCLSH